MASAKAAKIAVVEAFKDVVSQEAPPPPAMVLRDLLISILSPQEGEFYKVLQRRSRIRTSEFGRDFGLKNNQAWNVLDRLRGYGLIEASFDVTRNSNLWNIKDVTNGKSNKG